MEDKDPSKKHFIISLIKSGWRIAAGGFLMFEIPHVGSHLFAAGVCLVVAELLGILEEL